MNSYEHTYDWAKSISEFSTKHHSASRQPSAPRSAPQQCLPSTSPNPRSIKQGLQQRERREKKKGVGGERGAREEEGAGPGFCRGPSQGWRLGGALKRASQRAEREHLAAPSLRRPHGGPAREGPRQGAQDRRWERPRGAGPPRPAHSGTWRPKLRRPQILP